MTRAAVGLRDAIAAYAYRATRPRSRDVREHTHCNPDQPAVIRVFALLVMSSYPVRLPIAAKAKFDAVLRLLVVMASVVRIECHEERRWPAVLSASARSIAKRAEGPETVKLIVDMLNFLSNIGNAGGRPTGRPAQQDERPQPRRLEPVMSEC